MLDYLCLLHYISQGETELFAPRFVIAAVLLKVKLMNQPHENKVSSA